VHYPCFDDLLPFPSSFPPSLLPSFSPYVRRSAWWAPLGFAFSSRPPASGGAALACLELLGSCLSVPSPRRGRGRRRNGGGSRRSTQVSSALSHLSIRLSLRLRSEIATPPFPSSSSGHPIALPLPPPHTCVFPASAMLMLPARTAAWMAALPVAEASLPLMACWEERREGGGERGRGKRWVGSSVENGHGGGWDSIATVRKRSCCSLRHESTRRLCLRQGRVREEGTGGGGGGRKDREEGRIDHCTSRRAFSFSSKEPKWMCFGCPWSPIVSLHRARKSLVCLPAHSVGALWMRRRAMVDHDEK